MKRLLDYILFFSKGAGTEIKPINKKNVFIIIIIIISIISIIIIIIISISFSIISSRAP